MSQQTIDNKYTITYSNHFWFEGKLLAFRKKELFDITHIPTHINRSQQGWWIGKKLLSPATAQKAIVNQPIVKDVSDLQWFQQEQLNHVFNLNV